MFGPYGYVEKILCLTRKVQSFMQVLLSYTAMAYELWRQEAIMAYHFIREFMFQFGGRVSTTACSSDLSVACHTFLFGHCF